MKRMNERGFTLLELVSVTLLLFGMLVGAMWLLRKVDYSKVNTDTQRKTDIAEIAQGIHRYAQDTGSYPPGLPTKPTAIGSPKDHFNLCSYLVPKYLKDIPLDPAVGVKEDGSGAKVNYTCNTPNVQYATAFAIQQNKDGSVTVFAPLAIKGIISITLPAL